MSVRILSPACCCNCGLCVSSIVRVADCGFDFFHTGREYPEANRFLVVVLDTAMYYGNDPFAVPRCPPGGNVFAKCMIPPRPSYPCGRDTIADTWHGLEGLDLAGWPLVPNGGREPSCYSGTPYVSPDANVPNSILLRWVARNGNLDHYERFSPYLADGMTATATVDWQDDTLGGAQNGLDRRFRFLTGLEIRNGKKFARTAGDNARTFGVNCTGATNCCDPTEQVLFRRYATVTGWAGFRLIPASDLCAERPAVTVAVPGDAACPTVRGTPPLRSWLVADGYAIIAGWEDPAPPTAPNGIDSCRTLLQLGYGGWSAGRPGYTAEWGCADFPAGRDPLATFDGAKHVPLGGGYDVTVNGL